MACPGGDAGGDGVVRQAAAGLFGCGAQGAGPSGPGRIGRIEEDRQASDVLDHPGNRLGSPFGRESWSGAPGSNASRLPIRSSPRARLEHVPFNTEASGLCVLRKNGSLLGIHRLRVCWCRGAAPPGRRGIGLAVFRWGEFAAIVAHPLMRAMLSWRIPPPSLAVAGAGPSGSGVTGWSSRQERGWPSHRWAVERRITREQSAQSRVLAQVHRCSRSVDRGRPAEA
jgi:hypothetical protein